MKSALAVASLALALACSAPSEPAKADPTVDQQQIVNRLNGDIWPAMDNYSYVQASKAHQRFANIVDPTLQDTGNLYDVVQTMAHRGQVDPDTRAYHWSDDWKIVNTDIKAEAPDRVTVNVCYTYDHSWYERIEDTQHAPGASEATVGLVNVNNAWYLSSISKDHAVPNCQSNKA